MKSDRPALWLLIAVLASALPACSAPRQPRYFAHPSVAHMPVNLQLWCDTLADTYCNRCGTGDPYACRDAFVPPCIAGRNPGAVTVRAGYELQVCSDSLAQVDCGAVARGQLPWACRGAP